MGARPATRSPRAAAIGASSSPYNFIDSRLESFHLKCTISHSRGAKRKRGPFASSQRIGSLTKDPSSSVRRAAVGEKRPPTVAGTIDVNYSRASTVESMWPDGTDEHSRAVPVGKWQGQPGRVLLGGSPGSLGILGYSLLPRASAIRLKPWYRPAWI
jgi:hypothetical protein